MKADDDHVLYTHSNYGYRNRVAAYNDAMKRNAQAEEEHKDFFTSAEHNDICDRSIALMNNVLGVEKPDYENARGLGRQRNKPFTAIKYRFAGPKMSKFTKSWKEENIYAPLRALGITNAKCNLRGEFVFRVYAGPKKK